MKNQIAQTLNNYQAKIDALYDERDNLLNDGYSPKSKAVYDIDDDIQTLKHCMNAFERNNFK